MYFCLHWILFFALLAWDRLIIACFKIVMVMFDIIFFFVAIASADQFQDSSPARSQSYIWIRDDLQRPGLTERGIRRVTALMASWSSWMEVGFFTNDTYGMHTVCINACICNWSYIHTYISYVWMMFSGPDLDDQHTYVYTYIHTVAVSRRRQDSLW